MESPTIVKVRTFITKSKAGHYRVTLKDAASRVSHSSAVLFDNLEQARAAVPSLKEELLERVKERQN